LKLFFDPKRWEVATAVSFPRNGRWSVDVWLANNANSFALCCNYQFDVSASRLMALSPIEFIEPDREFPPLETPAGFKLMPSCSHECTVRPLLEIVAEFVGELTLTLVPFGTDAGIPPKTLFLRQVQGRQRAKYVFACSQLGDFDLRFWLNSTFFSQIWHYRTRPQHRTEDTRR
jgi:hypothetical protein